MKRLLLFLAFAGFFSPAFGAGVTNYWVRGILKQRAEGGHRLMIAHEAIPDFMEAMTMPFNVRGPAVPTNLVAGDAIRFQLYVTETESWIDHIQPIDRSQSSGGGVSGLSENRQPPGPRSVVTSRATNALRDYKFTNELGQPVSLSDFRGQAIALTFFFTRCPIPEFCPRLSRNFEAVQRKLTAMNGAVTNWHLLSVTFDPAHDTPAVLKAYGGRYGYDPKHWSFLTGPKDKIAELARACDVRFDPENGLFNHNFRTLIIDASNRLQMVFPTSGDLSDSIAQELIKAAGGTNPMRASTAPTRTGSGQ